MNMVEQVAKAIDECPEWPAKTYRSRTAVAAIEAMRSPTEAMLATQGKSRPDLAKNDAIRLTAETLNAEARRMAAETWVEMIDAALSHSDQQVPA